jgi:hypothetical protein
MAYRDFSWATAGWPEKRWKRVICCQQNYTVNHSTRHFSGTRLGLFKLSVGPGSDWSHTDISFLAGADGRSTQDVSAGLKPLAPSANFF